MQDDRFERHLAEWLEEGPFEAPDRAVPAAVTHAQAHPRRRLSLRRLARAMTIRVGSTADPLVRGPARLTALGAAGAAVVAVVLIAAGGVFLLRPVPDRTAIGWPPPTAAPTPTPPVSVVATSVCHQVDPGTTSSVTSSTGDVTQRREVEYGCTLASADPRLQGNATFTLNADERADGSADIWGSATIGTDGGGWDGFWIGTVDAGGTVYRIEAGYQGTGGYESLRLGTSQVSEELSGTIDGTIADVGTPPTASEPVITGASCLTLSGPVSGSASQGRGARLKCSVQSADPRFVSDLESIVANGDERADGSATIWGTATLSNAGGMWQSTWQGSVEAGYTTHRMDGVAVGSGDYAGLEYHFSQIGASDLIVRIGNVIPVSP